MNSFPNQDKYSEIANHAWTAQQVRELLTQDPNQLYASLPSIMQDSSSDSSWKTALALDLLRMTNADSFRARVWDSLAILARKSRFSQFEELASIAWSVTDAFINENKKMAELCSVQDFLNDLRSHAVDANTTLLDVDTHRNGEARFNIFIHLRALCCYGDINIAGSEILRLADHCDFVIRESVVNGISIIYSRPDCHASDVNNWVDSFQRILSKRCNDPHWYVRKANETALFFEQEFIREISGI